MVPLTGFLVFTLLNAHWCLRSTGNRQGSLPGGPVTGPPGRNTGSGNYIIDDTRVRVYVCPPPEVLEKTLVRMKSLLCCSDVFTEMVDFSNVYV